MRNSCMSHNSNRKAPILRVRNLYLHRKSNPRNDLENTRLASIRAINQSQPQMDPTERTTAAVSSRHPEKASNAPEKKEEGGLLQRKPK
jgi:hypothetical protein